MKTSKHHRQLFVTNPEHSASNNALQSSSEGKHKYCWSEIGIFCGIMSFVVLVLIKWAFRHPEAPIVQYYHHFSPSDLYDTSLYYQTIADHRHNRTAQLLFLLRQYETEILFTLSNNVIQQGDEYFRVIPDSKTSGKQFSLMDADLCRTYTLLNLFEIAQIDRVNVLQLFPYKPIAGTQETRILPVTPPPMNLGVSSKRDILIVFTTCCNQLTITIMSLQFLRNTGKIADILVIDDASTDGTVSYIQRKGFAVIVKTVAKGVTDSWNIGYRMAVALGYKHILFTNNDVLLTAGAVHLMHHSLKLYPLVVPLTTDEGAGHHKLQSIFESLNVSTKFSTFANDYRNAEFIQEALLRKYIYVPKDQRRCPSQTSISYETGQPKFNGFCFGVNLELIAPAAFEDKVHLFDPKDVIVGQEDALTQRMAEHNLVPVLLHCTFVYHFKSRTVSAANFTAFQELASQHHMEILEMSSFPTVKLAYQDPQSQERLVFLIDIREDLRWYHQPAAINSAPIASSPFSSESEGKSAGVDNQQGISRDDFVQSVLSRAKFIEQESQLLGPTLSTPVTPTEDTRVVDADIVDPASAENSLLFSDVWSAEHRSDTNNKQGTVKPKQHVSTLSHATGLVGGYGAKSSAEHSDDPEGIWKDFACRPISSQVLFPKRPLMLAEPLQRQLQMARVEFNLQSETTMVDSQEKTEDKKVPRSKEDAADADRHRTKPVINNNERNLYVQPSISSLFAGEDVPFHRLSWNMRSRSVCVYPSSWDAHCRQLLLQETPIESISPSAATASSMPFEAAHELHMSSVYNTYGKETVHQSMLHSNVFDPELYALSTSNHLVFAIAMSDPVATPSAGDIFTAQELAAALMSLYKNVHVKLLPKGPAWYDVGQLHDVDVLIVLLDDFDVTKVLGLFQDPTVPNYFTSHAYVCPYVPAYGKAASSANLASVSQTEGQKVMQIKSNLITIAWMRNWFHRWLTKPWLGNYDILLTSSELSQMFFQEISVKLGLKSACVNSCPHKATGVAPPVLPVKYRARVQAKYEKPKGIRNNDMNEKFGTSGTQRGRKLMQTEEGVSPSNLPDEAHAITDEAANSRHRTHPIGDEPSDFWEHLNTDFLTATHSSAVPHHQVDGTSKRRFLRAAAGAIIADFHWTFFSPRISAPHRIFSFPLATSRIIEQDQHPVISNASLTAAQLFTNVDYIFTGSYFNVYRRIMDFDPASLDAGNSVSEDSEKKFVGRIVGANWQRANVSHAWKEIALGFLPYEVVLEAYPHVKVVIDDANHVTSPWGSTNSRVFDALGSGALILSNGVIGMFENFGDVFRDLQTNWRTRYIPLPIFESAEELTDKLRYFLTHEAERALVVERLARVVAAKHTYPQRARDLSQVLAQTFQLHLQPVASVDSPSSSAVEGASTAPEAPRRRGSSSNRRRALDTAAPEAERQQRRLFEAELRDHEDRHRTASLSASSNAAAAVTASLEDEAGASVNIDQDRRVLASAVTSLRPNATAALSSSDSTRRKSASSSTSTSSQTKPTKSNTTTSTSTSSKKDENSGKVATKKSDVSQKKSSKKKVVVNDDTKDAKPSTSTASSSKYSTSANKSTSNGMEDSTDSKKKKKTSKSGSKSKGNSKTAATATKEPTPSKQSQASKASPQPRLLPPGRGLCIGVRTTERDDLWLPVLIRSLIVQHSKSAKYRDRLPMQIFLIDTEAKTEYVEYLFQVADTHNERFRYPYVQIVVSKKATPQGSKNKLYGYDDTDVLLEEMLRLRHCTNSVSRPLVSYGPPSAFEDTSNRHYSQNPKTTNGRYMKYTKKTPLSNCEWVMFTNGDNMYNAAWFDMVAPLALSNSYDIIGWDFITHHLREHQEWITTSSNKRKDKKTNSVDDDAPSMPTLAARNVSAPNQRIEISLQRGFVDLGSVMIRAHLFGQKRIRFLDNAVFTEDLFLRDFRTLQSLIQTIDPTPSPTRSNKKKGSAQALTPAEEERNRLQRIHLIHQVLLMHQ